ncbi:MAG: S8 family serine peptidase [Burkholderiales bacterium]|nr:S8 family serine peptidase [Burkholderiales bacterium]
MKQRYILLPPQGVRLAGAGRRPARGTDAIQRFLSSAARSSRTAMRVRPVRGRSPASVRVLDSVHEDGAKLVEMSAADVHALRTAQPGVRVLPELFYKPAINPRPLPARAARTVRAARAALGTLTVRVVARADGKPVKGAQVVALTDFEAREGDAAVTDARGEATLRLSATAGTIERLYVYPEVGLWGALQRNLRARSTIQVALAPLDLAAKGALGHFFGTARLTAGRGVTVGVIDTGVGDHPDLVVAGGENTVQGERPDEWRDNGAGHGTHVAGIVAARGRRSGRGTLGMRGLAPAVTLRSYRVFAKGGGLASNFAILKALDRAVADGCDLVNLSLGGAEPDAATSAAIADARAQGVLVVAAAGNDGRQPVNYPGADQLALGVSAMGRKGTYPGGSTHAAEAMPPYGRDRRNFIAAFSNIGPEIDLTGPGVAIVSTFPGGYAALDGTSMACPAVTGAAAALLARKLGVLRMPRGQGRSDAMAKAVLAAARSLGFAPEFEGRGML